MIELNETLRIWTIIHSDIFSWRRRRIRRRYVRFVTLKVYRMNCCPFYQSDELNNNFITIKRHLNTKTNNENIFQGNILKHIFYLFKVTSKCSNKLITLTWSFDVNFWNSIFVAVFTSFFCSSEWNGFWTVHFRSNENDSITSIYTEKFCVNQFAIKNGIKNTFPTILNIISIFFTHFCLKALMKRWLSFL